MEIIKNNMNLRLVLQFVFIAVLLLVLWAFGVDALMLLSVGIITVLFFICMKNINLHCFFFFFLVSFFIYLMSGDIAELIFNEHYYISFGAAAVKHAHFCIFLSLASILLGFLVSKQRSVHDEEQVVDKAKSDFIVQIRKAAKLIYWVSFVILLINTLDVILFVAGHGYVEYYLSYSTTLPTVIAEIGDFAPMALCVFLATFPSKKEAMPVVLSYVLYALVSLLAGARGAMVYNVVFILCYLLYRNHTDKGKTVWISRRLVILLVISVPFVLVFLFLYEYIRSDTAVEYQSFGQTLVAFFVNIGASSKVIKYGYEYSDFIPQWRFYSFGETLNYFKYGTLFNLFSLDSIPPTHSAQFALESHSFDSLISYLTMESKFLDGHGTGSSFIAELYADFGYVGVSLGGIVYGWLFKKLSYINPQRWLSSTIKLYMFMALIKAPRGSFDGFIAAVVNVNFIVLVFAIWVLANIFRSINKSKLSKQTADTADTADNSADAANPEKP